ncbi:hypothetical protein D3C76_664860 [compost metagenome]
MHGRIVVAGGHAFDVETAVIGLDRAFRAEHHAAGHGGLAAGVADVVALQALRYFVQAKHLGQGLETGGHVLAIGQAGVEGLLGVGHCQLLPAGPGAAHPVGDGQLAAAQGLQGFTDGFEVFVHHVDDEFAGQFAFGIAHVVLGQERGHDLGHLLLDAHLGEEVLAAQHPPAAHADQVHAGATGVDEGGDHIDVTGTALDVLLVLHAAQQGDLVAQLGGLLEIEGHGGLFHLGIELVAQLLAAAFEEHHRVANIVGVLVFVDQADARPLAALDLVLQAGPGAVGVVAVFALAHRKGLLQQAEAFANGTGAGVWAEVSALGLFRTAMDAQAREVAVRQKHVGVGFIVAQQDVVRRPPFLDQVLLQQQRLGLVGGDGGLDLGDAAHQRSGLGRQAGFAEIAGQALLEVFGLAHVEQPRLGVEHTINARATAAGRQERAGIKSLGHEVYRLASTIPWRTASKVSSTSLVTESFSKIR